MNNTSKKPVTDLIALNLTEFLKQDIPPVTYVIDKMVQENGKAMVSGAPNIGKSIFLQNMTLAIARGDSLFSKFKTRPQKTLYLDCEMGNSALQERYRKMAPNGEGNLIVKYYPSIDLLNQDWQSTLEEIIEDHEIKVVLIDPIGNAWSGDECKKQDVQKLTAYFNDLIARLKITVVIAHHFRKTTKGQRKDGERAAGSYHWRAWVDNHITLEGSAEQITVRCDKSRNAMPFDSFNMCLNIDNLWMEHIGECDGSRQISKLISLFDNASKLTGLHEIPVSSHLIRYALDNKICKSKQTVWDWINSDQVSERPVFRVTKDKPVAIARKDVSSESNSGN